ncbi:hypothetical protein [Paenibacillus shenyangensis]|uniref:hypothetical protein n=1 Tax=Paenibacillus sp. A9 TaxID=1284352 RepID=UPI0003696CF9|nr:hypothetical protein [Paenibacillus sp. A9]
MFNTIPLQQPIQVGILTTNLPQLVLKEDQQYLGKSIQFREEERPHIERPDEEGGHSADLRKMLPYLLSHLNAPMAYGRHEKTFRKPSRYYSYYQNRFELYYLLDEAIHLVVLEFNPDTPQHLNIQNCYKLDNGFERLANRMERGYAFYTSQATITLPAA